MIRTKIDNMFTIKLLFHRCLLSHFLYDLDFIKKKPEKDRKTCVCCIVHSSVGLSDQLTRSLSHINNSSLSR